MLGVKLLHLHLTVLCASLLPRGPSDLTRRRAAGLVHNSTMRHRSWRQLEASSNNHGAWTTRWTLGSANSTASIT